MSSQAEQTGVALALAEPGAAAAITAVLLAGRRPGRDPLAERFGVADKALIDLDGEPMLSRVARTLLDHPGVGRVLVVAQDPELLLETPGTAWLAGDARVATEAGRGSIGGTLASLLDSGRGYPFLVTTADNVLLDHAMLDLFIGEMAAVRPDIGLALVERATLTARYPGSRRTWLKFRGGAYSGANLFWLGSRRARHAVATWAGVEQERKRGRAIVAAFGPWLLAGAFLRLLTLSDVLAAAGRRLSLTAHATVLPIAEACIDVDNADDHALATRIMQRRRRNA